MRNRADRRLSARGVLIGAGFGLPGSVSENNRWAHINGYVNIITGTVQTAFDPHYRRNIHDPPRIDLIWAQLYFWPYVPAIFLILIRIWIIASDFA